MVKALHCHLKNLGLIPLATTSLCAHRQISSYLFAQITIHKMGLRTLLTDSAAHEEFAAVVKSTHCGLKQQVSGVCLLDNDFIYSSWKELIPHLKAEYCSHNSLLFTGQDLKPVLVLKKMNHSTKMT